MGLMALATARHMDDPRLVELAADIARAYLGEPFPEDINVPAKDAGLAIGLLAELPVKTGEEAWLEGAFHLAEAHAPRYLDHRLPRGASGIDWYESQMLPGHLLTGLARAALAALGDTTSLDADFTCR
jgi:hypothetical protein